MFTILVLTSVSVLDLSVIVPGFTANSLSAENRRLRKVHMTLSDEIVNLMRIDLLGKSDAWKAKWNSIKTIMADQERKYPAVSLVKWRQHWDHQVYKVSALFAVLCF